MFKRLYDWTVSLAASPRAPYALGAVSFAESSFFPIPPDVVLAPMSLARPDKAFRYAAICTVTSVAGGILGYAIGAMLFESVGLWLLNLYGLGDKIDNVKLWYATWGAMFILVKGLTPIPYKVVTIVSGALAYDFPMFVILSIITRGARFFIIAGIFNRWGAPLKVFIEKHLTAVALVTLAAIGLGFWLITRLF
jgi:membrane protein YqaA with SNARE-associated domain